MRADYYEAVWQSVDGDKDGYDYTGITGSYDDGSTEDECLRCPSCFVEAEVYGEFRFIPTAVLEDVQKILNAHDSAKALKEMEKTE